MVMVNGGEVVLRSRGDRWWYGCGLRQGNRHGLRFAWRWQSMGSVVISYDASIAELLLRS
jgi:ribosomal protein L27